MDHLVINDGIGIGAEDEPQKSIRKAYSETMGFGDMYSLVN